MTAIADIQRVVAQHYGIAKADFLGPLRTRKFAHPRQLAMYLARKMTTVSLPVIGRAFGNRDHTTVLNGVRQVKRRLEKSKELSATVAILRERIGIVTLQRELDTLSMRVYSAQIVQAKWDDPDFVALPPEPISEPATIPPEPVKPSPRVKLNAYGVRRPVAVLQPVTAEHYRPGHPLPSAFPEAEAA